MDKDIERLLKEFDTKYPGIRDRSTGLTSSWKLIRDDNRVLTTKGKHKGKCKSKSKSKSKSRSSK